jgi:hypothetical protein
LTQTAENRHCLIFVKIIFAIPIYHPDTASDVSQISQHLIASMPFSMAINCMDIWELDETTDARQ